MNANTIRTTPTLQKYPTLVAAVIITMTIFLGVSQPASAAAYQYCCVNVQAGAAARTDATVANNLAGWVTPDQFLGRPSNTQRSYVRCYKDGDWATGNYRSNRWFSVYVNLSNGRIGYFFAHSSYVYNQTSVPRC